AVDSPQSIEQKHINTGGGDNIGGNKVEIKNTFNYATPASSDVLLQSLYVRLAQEMKSNSSCATVVSILEEFVATHADEVVGLTTKLLDGGMDTHVDYAEEAK